MRRSARLLCASLLVAIAPALAQPDKAAGELAERILIVDTHIDAPGMLQESWRDLTIHTDREFDWPKAKAGGLDIAFMSIYTSPGEDAAGTAYSIANQQIDAVIALASRAPDKFAVLTSPRDIERLRTGGQVLLPMGMENGAPLAGKLENLQFFFDRGVRYITLAHSAANAIADSSYGVERKWNGLSPFGRELVTRMNRLGMMVDVSHLSDAAATEAIRLSRVPVIASHSAFRHFTPDFERNISDELAIAIAKKGGVVQIPFGTAFVNPQAAANIQAKFRGREALRQRNEAARAAGQPEEDRAAWEAAWEQAHPPLATDIEAVLVQIDYGVKLIGINHIGIGSDFDGVGGELPDQLRTAADFPKLIAGLKARGYSDTDIGKIMGGNFLRSWKLIEAGADRR
ncbi:MAG: dipeptidase [Pseudomonadota bacterium]|nr:dipeptidase [Pseudomonadota bacterium]